VIGGDIRRLPGGKGANQAVAAARLGASVRMVGAVGDDAAGIELIETLRAAGVDVSAVRIVPAPTGAALVLVDDTGENQIVVSVGANAHLEIEPADVAAADTVLAQLELPLATVRRAAALTTGMFVLNAAPAREVPADLLDRCDLVVVNDGERASIRGLDRARLLAVTHGAGGATLLEGGKAVAHASAPSVSAVDTVGAGDAFTAALAVRLTQGHSPVEALEFACVAGALATTRHGAQSALPDLGEVLMWLQNAS
jgi:ribokinase